MFTKKLIFMFNLHTSWSLPSLIKPLLTGKEKMYSCSSSNQLLHQKKKNRNIHPIFNSYTGFSKAAQDWNKQLTFSKHDLGFVSCLSYTLSFCIDSVYIPSCWVSWVKLAPLLVTLVHPGLPSLTCQASM